MVGVGLLALPLAFADAGWLLGSFLLLFCALITNCRLPFFKELENFQVPFSINHFLLSGTIDTAKILARLMARDEKLETYSDVLIKALGPSARSFIHSMCKANFLWARFYRPQKADFITSADSRS